MQNELREILIRLREFTSDMKSSDDRDFMYVILDHLEHIYWEIRNEKQ